jgi:hypothetical protein
LTQPGRWEVYFVERDEIIDPRVFDDEDQACDYVCSLLTRPSDAGRKPTDEELRRADQLAREREERFRARLSAAGLAPRTGQNAEPF